MKTNLVRAMALVAAVGMTACGDDGPTATGDTLSEAEISALSGIILGSAIQATAGIPGASPVDGPQAAPFSYSADIETTVPCSGGGSIGLNGSATINGDDETGAFAIAYNVTSSYANCTEFAEETEQEYTVGGSLAMTANADYTQGQGEEFGNLTSTGSFTGNINWESGDRSGTCAVSMTSSVTVQGQTISAQTTGSFCGTSINETFTYGVDS